MSELTTFIYGLLIFFVFAPFLRWWVKRARLVQIIDKIPGPKSYPFIGTTYTFFGKKHYGEWRTVALRIIINGVLLRKSIADRLALANEGKVLLKRTVMNVE